MTARADDLPIAADHELLDLIERLDAASDMVAAVAGLVALAEPLDSRRQRNRTNALVAAVRGCLS
jgi:hypothetical protein